MGSKKGSFNRRSTDLAMTEAERELARQELVRAIALSLTELNPGLLSRGELEILSRQVIELYERAQTRAAARDGQWAWFEPGQAADEG